MMPVNWNSAARLLGFVAASKNSGDRLAPLKDGAGLILHDIAELCRPQTVA